MTLTEILDTKDMVTMLRKKLTTEGYDVDQTQKLWVRVKGAVFSVHVFVEDEEAGTWFIVWYKDGRKVHQDDSLSFEQVMAELEPFKPAK